MTVYKDVEQINRIINLAPENFDFFVHIDKKSCVNTTDISHRAHVFKEFQIYWGAVEHLKAFLFLMEKAFETHVEYDFYHLITGQDFYACSFKSFDGLLESGKNYVEFHLLPRKGWWHGGFKIIKYKTLASKGDIRKGLTKFKNILYFLFQKILRRTNPLPNYPMGCGSVYCSLCGGVIDYILHSDISQDLLHRLTDTTCGEEIFFQTVLYNSPFKRDMVNNNLRYIDWSVANPPKYLLLQDEERILTSNCLFCRKIDSFLSKELIQKLMSRIIVK